MTKVQEIQAAMESLSHNKYDYLKSWFMELLSTFFILILFFMTSCESQEVDHEIKTIDTYEKYANLVREMQKDLKGYYAKGNMKSNKKTFDSKSGQEVSFEIWVRMPQSPDLSASFHYVGKHPPYYDNYYDYYNDKTRKYMKWDLWFNGKSLWESGGEEGDSIKQVYLYNYEDIQKEGIPIYIFVMNCSIPIISPLLHYGRIIDMECFYPIEKIHSKILFLKKERHKPYKGTLIFEQTESISDDHIIKSKVWLDPLNGLMRKYERIESELGLKPEKRIMEIIDLQINPPELESMSFDFVPPPDAIIRDGNEYIKHYQFKDY